MKLQVDEITREALDELGGAVGADQVERICFVMRWLRWVGSFGRLRFRRNGWRGSA